MGKSVTSVKNFDPKRFEYKRIGKYMEVLPQAIELRQKYWPIKKIAEHFGLKPNYMAKVFKKHGIK